MKKMRYITLFSLLLTVDAFGMNNSNSNNQELSGSRHAYDEMANNNNNDNNVEFFINILMPRNAKGASTELLSLNDIEPIALESFKDLIQAKQDVKDSYILARVLTDSGKFVQYFDANTLNLVLFSKSEYPFGNLKELNQYKNPYSGLPIEKLDYYQCAPTQKTFEYWCSYADLSKADNPNIHRTTLYANQTDNHAAAAREQCNRVFLNIPMPRNARGTSTELLSLNDIEPLTFESFKNLIQAKQDVKDSYILARVLTDSGRLVQYFDANKLNLSLFNQYPFANFKELNQYRNSCSKLPIEKLDYYQCAPTQKTFEYWCSYADLSKADNPNGDRNIYRMMFYANQTANLAVAATAQVTLGLLKEESDLAEAMRLYTRAANQTDDLAVAARAQFNLALLKQKGEPEEAVRLYTRAASQNANLSVAAQAQNNLGCIYERALKYAKAKELFEKAAANKKALAKSNIALLYLLGHGVDKDLNEAVELFLSVANQTENSYAAACAQYYLGCIYLFKSEVRDYESTQVYLSQVISQTENESAVAAAKNALAWMSWHGKGVPKNIEQAKNYYTEVSQQSKNNGARVIAKISLKQIEALQK